MAMRDSSRRWLARQKRDPYVRRARAGGYRSRAAYKLADMDRRAGLFKKGQSVVDLGAAPGGWSQIAAERVVAGRIVAVDAVPMAPIAGVEVLEADIHAPSLAADIRRILAGSADMVLSDLAPPTTGHRATDQARAENMALAALDLAQQILVSGGDFLVKTRHGGTDEIAARLKAVFAKVIFIKPDASRDVSAEIYLLARGYQRGG